MIPQLRWVAALLLCALVAWAPLPWGSAPPWAQSILMLGAAAALFAAAVGARNARRLAAVRVPFLCLLGLAALGLMQSLPLPRGLVGLVSPAHGAISGEVSEMLGGAWARLSLAPAVSRRAAIWCAALAAAFAAAALAAERSARRRWIFGSILAAAGFQAAFGAREWLANRATIWGVQVPQPPGRLRGSFVNPNHLGFLLALSLALAFALAWWVGRRGGRSASWRRTAAPLIVAAGLWVALFITLALTGSRAALLGALAGTALQAALLARGGRRWLVVSSVGLLLAAGLAVVGVFAFEGGFGRLARTSGFEVIWNDRWAAYGATLRLWSRFPLTGCGLGAFLDGFPMVQPASLHEVWRHAHSDWLELLATTGLVGAALLAVGLVALVRRLATLLRPGNRSEARAAALAALGALTAAGVHSALDFSLTMPADALTLAVLLGCAAGAPAVPGGRRRRGRSSAGELDGDGLGDRSEDGDQLDEVGSRPAGPGDGDAGAGG